MLADKTDEELMVAYQLGDDLAFQELYSRYSKRVFGFLKGRVGDPTVAGDIFQATFLKLHRSREKYNPAVPFVAWLFTVCRSELIDALRKNQKASEKVVALSASEMEDIPDLLSENWNSRTPNLDLSSLPQRQREALELRFNEGFSFEDIATRLQTSPGNARQLIHRAIQFLKVSNEKK